ncbi:MAG: GTPase, partial [Candidatus Zixiibacteriota bacterium]
MQVGIVGLPFSGKTTIFNALTQARAKTGDFSAGAKEPNRAVVKIPDDRVYRLAELYNPKKVTPAEVEWVDVGGMTDKIKEKASEAEFLR